MTAATVWLIINVVGIVASAGFTADAFASYRLAHYERWQLAASIALGQTFGGLLICLFFVGDAWVGYVSVSRLSLNPNIVVWVLVGDHSLVVLALFVIAAFKIQAMRQFVSQHPLQHEVDSSTATR